jgi:medium-chain acyl-[acyl-carrier-protein] hydrolase
VIYTTRVTAWVPPYLHGKRGARVKLFCFPYAGGGASIFLAWDQLLGADVELWPIQLPGRENRIHEPFSRSVEEICDAMAHDPLLPFRGTFAFFGHSLGAIIAYELAQRLRQVGRPQPTQLLISAHRAPQIPLARRPTWNLPDVQFRQRLMELNGTPRAVFENPELLQLILPRMRADLRLAETYSHLATHVPLSCAITAFGGKGDHETSVEHLEPWRAVTGGPFQMQMFEGDHFFIHSNRHSLLSAVKAVLFGERIETS